MSEYTAILKSANGIDVFGDIHGHAAILETALIELGYENRSGIWRHPAGRKTLFLGDLIDRGPQNRQTVNLVRQMALAGEAVCLMGNHELNAVHFATEHPHQVGLHLRPRTDKNLRQHLAFLSEYHLDTAGREALAKDIAWFKSLPLWIDLGTVRAVHACWSPDQIVRLSRHLNNAVISNDEIWQRTATAGDELMDAIEVILKGVEARLPDGVTFKDKDGHERDHARVKWWQDAPYTWGDALLLPPEIIDKLKALDTQTPLPRLTPPPDRPTFFGHYWFSPRDGAPWLASPLAACLDFSVAHTGGVLCVYRWDGENKLRPEKLCSYRRCG